MHLRPAASAGHLMARARLCDEHRRLQIDAHDLVEFLFADVGEQLLALNADAIDEQVEPSVLIARAVDGRRIDSTLAASATTASACRPALRIAAASDSALCAVRPTMTGRACEREPPTNRFTDTAVAARHEGDQAIKAKLGGELACVDQRRPSSQSISRPPLMSTISPVMKPASGDARKRTT